MLVICLLPDYDFPSLQCGSFVCVLLNCWVWSGLSPLSHWSHHLKCVSSSSFSLFRTPGLRYTWLCAWGVPYRAVESLHRKPHLGFILSVIFCLDDLLCGPSYFLGIPERNIKRNRHSECKRDSQKHMGAEARIQALPGGREEWLSSWHSWRLPWASGSHHVLTACSGNTETTVLRLLSINCWSWESIAFIKCFLKRKMLFID